MRRDTNKLMMLATHNLVEESGYYDKARHIIDYFNPEKFTIQELTNHEFNFIAKVNFGCCEGIYIDCYIEGRFDNTGEFKRLKCGTYKTLSSNLNAMQIMGELAGSLTYYNRQYVNKEIDRYIPDTKSSFKINCSMDMLEKVKAFTEKHRLDKDADKNVLLSVKIAKQLSDELSGQVSNVRFSFEDLSKLEKVINDGKEKIKVYRTKDRRNYSLEPILNDGRYCAENECDIAGIYSIPKEVNITISGGRMSLDSDAFFIDKNGDPAIGLYSGTRLMKILDLEKASNSKGIADLEERIDKYRSSNNILPDSKFGKMGHMER